ncbi:hypothetical protein INN71_15080 [Nocardioides sp. ChNu-153]|uniref:hypothetical protein n=1 Tax=Nocardioides sp. ChNu-153 TaxID=2779364 RepID=UPI002651B07F|nr:hypothetical protein [Nocardioides sp. ChNu-153]MDN7122712.1 hypothetical protein [Nocardioides sp. ChNu-153]
MSLRHPRLLTIVGAVLLALVAVIGPQPTTADARVASPVEPFARYEPQTGCTSKIMPGMQAYSSQLTARYGGRIIGITRACSSGGRSEHKESRALDWNLDARNANQRQAFYRFLAELQATDAAGNVAARARRQGVMYVIWNDRIWSAWNGFQVKPYLHANCTSVAKCSPTLRHVDHVHVSLSWAGARGLTSWYTGG